MTIRRACMLMVAAVLLLTPQLVYADACDDLREQFNQSGGTDLLNKLPQYCTEGAVYQQIINIAYGAIGIFGVVFIMFGGYLYMTARSNDEQRKRGRNMIQWSLLGVTIVLAAALLINILVNLLVDNKFI